PGAVPIQTERLGVVLDAARDRVPQAFAPSVAEFGQAECAPGQASEGEVASRATGAEVGGAVVVPVRTGQESIPCVGVALGIADRVADQGAARFGERGDGSGMRLSLGACAQGTAREQ